MISITLIKDLRLSRCILFKLALREGSRDNVLESEATITESETMYTNEVGLKKSWNG